MAISNYQAMQLNNSNVAMQRAKVGTLLKELEEAVAALEPASISALDDAINDPDTGLLAVVSALDDAINAPDTGLLAVVDALSSSVSALAMQKLTHTVVAEDISDETTTVELAVDGVPSGIVITVIDDTGMVFGGYDVATEEGKVTITGAENALPIDTKITALVW